MALQHAAERMNGDSELNLAECCGKSSRNALETSRISSDERGALKIEGKKVIGQRDKQDEQNEKIRSVAASQAARSVCVMVSSAECDAAEDEFEAIPAAGEEEAGADDADICKSVCCNWTATENHRIEVETLCFIRRRTATD